MHPDARAYLLIGTADNMIFARGRNATGEARIELVSSADDTCGIWIHSSLENSVHQAFGARDTAQATVNSDRSVKRILRDVGPLSTR